MCAGTASFRPQVSEYRCADSLTHMDACTGAMQIYIDTPTPACRHEDLSHTWVERRLYIAPHGPHALFRHGVLSHATLDSNLNIANWAIKMTDLHIPNSSIANLEILERIGGITEHWQVQTNHLCPWVRVHAK